MSAIRAKNTNPELVIRTILHALGYRFRVHVAGLPGKPDIVIPKIRTILQVKGCFWHGHWCLKGRVPRANRTYWGPKIAGNRSRDLRNESKLRRQGWSVKTIWECDIRRSSAEQLVDGVRRRIGHHAGVAPTAGGVERVETILKLIRHRRIPKKRRHSKSGR
jgi:DNA mismatch endonuclease (patch repair protein)